MSYFCIGKLRRTFYNRSTIAANDYQASILENSTIAKILYIIKNIVIYNINKFLQ